MESKICGCGKPRRKSGRYCLDCHAAYMRRTRPKESARTPAQKKKARARTYANVYLKRGKIKRQPCRCGSLKAEMHHDDYDKPLKVRWLCRPCHLAYHANHAECGAQAGKR